MKLLVTVHYTARDGVEDSRQSMTEMASIPRAVEMALDALLPSVQERVFKVDVLVSGAEQVRTEPLGEYR